MCVVESVLQLVVDRSYLVDLGDAHIQLHLTALQLGSLVVELLLKLLKVDIHAVDLVS